MMLVKTKSQSDPGPWQPPQLTVTGEGWRPGLLLSYRLLIKVLEVVIFHFYGEKMREQNHPWCYHSNTIMSQHHYIVFQVKREIFLTQKVNEFSKLMV